MIVPNTVPNTLIYYNINFIKIQHIVLKTFGVTGLVLFNDDRQLRVCVRRAAMVAALIIRNQIQKKKLDTKLAIQLMVKN